MGGSTLGQALVYIFIVETESWGINKDDDEGEREDGPDLALKSDNNYQQMWMN